MPALIHASNASISSAWVERARLLQVWRAI